MGLFRWTRTGAEPACIGAGGRRTLTYVYERGWGKGKKTTTVAVHQSGDCNPVKAGPTPRGPVAATSTRPKAR